MSSLIQRRAVLASPPARPSRAMKFRAMAAQRLVAEWAMGNSQQVKDNYGFDYGWQNAMAQFVPLYATSVYPRGGDNAAGYNVGYSNPLTDGTRPTEFDAYLLPGRGPDAGPQPEVPSYQATGDAGNSGIVLGAGDGIDHRHRLRMHFNYGTFPTGAGYFQPFIRLEESPFTALLYGPTISSNTGAYGAVRDWIDLPADPARTAKLGFKWRPISGASPASVGPNQQISMQVEDLDTQVGYSLTSVYAVGGKSMSDMATYMAGMPDAQLRTMITTIVQIQLDRGLAPIMVVGIHEGENQRNEIDWSARNYLAQFLIVWNRIKYGWETLCGFPLGNLACDVHCGVPISFPQDNKMAAYDAIMDDYCRRDPAVSHARYQDTTPYQFMVDNDLFLDGLHLKPLGYQVLSLGDLAARMPKVPAINKDLPSISGVRGSGQTLTVVPGSWFQSPVLTYQWYADGIAIAGATGTSFVETATQSGKAVTVVETATANGLVSTATSASLLDTTSFLADYSGGSYYLNGAAYADEAAFNTAAGITKSGITRVSSPLVISGELIVNGTFDTDASGWTAQANTSIASVSGKGRITRSTATGAQWVYQTVVTEIGKAYRASWDVATISGNTLSTRWGNIPGGNIYSANTTAGTGKTADIADRVGSLYFSAGDAGVGNSGVGEIDNVSLKEMGPFPGYSGVAHTLVVEAVTGGTLPSGSHQVLWQEDIGAETNRRRLVWETDGHLWVRHAVNNVEVAALDLGAVAISTSIKVALGYATNDFAASLNGAAVVTDTAGSCPSAHTLRIGRSFTGETWTGTINKVHHRNTRLTNAFLVALSS